MFGEDTSGWDDGYGQDAFQSDHQVNNEGNSANQALYASPLSNQQNQRPFAGQPTNSWQSQPHLTDKPQRFDLEQDWDEDDDYNYEEAESERKRKAAIAGVGLVALVTLSAGAYLGFRTSDNSDLDTALPTTTAEVLNQTDPIEPLTTEPTAQTGIPNPTNGEMDLEAGGELGGDNNPAANENQPRPTSGPDYSALRNQNELYLANAGLSKAAIAADISVGLEGPAKPSNGPQPGQGQFRAYCTYSHISNDDPIVYPGEPGRSHMHTFFGNTTTDAYSTADSLLESGGSTCQGGVLNRSAYWTPTLLTGDNQAVLPRHIILYYKSHQPQVVQPLPQGLQMIAGNFEGTFDHSHRLKWECGRSGYTITGPFNQIPATCPEGEFLVAVVAFPNCWDGQNLASASPTGPPTHLQLIDENSQCPDGWVRIPQITILQYFEVPGSMSGWHLSSDDPSDPGGSTLHADWFGGWSDPAMELFINGCFRPPQNCSGGQTGTSQQLSAIGEGNRYTGEVIMDLPADAYERP